MDRNALIDAIRDLLGIQPTGDAVLAPGLPQMIFIALAVMLGLLLLAGVAGLLSHWLRHELDKMFERLFLVVLGAVLAWLLLGGYLRLM